MMTSDPDLLTASSELRAEARRWLVHLHSGEVVQADLDAARQWREQSAAHRAAFAEANAQWQALRAMRRGAPIADVDTVAARHRLGRRALLGGAAAAAAGAAIYVGIRPPLGLWPSFSEFTADVRTGVGERRRIALSDDVTIDLNTRTSLVMDHARNEQRRIELLAGQIAATVGVNRDGASMPLAVSAGPAVARATQAVFDLSFDGEAGHVTCLEGSLTLQCNGESTTLRGHEQIAYTAKGLGVAAANDGRVTSAWRDGRLLFENAPLSEAIEEINRYRRGRIILMSGDVGQLPLNAAFRLDRLDEVVPKLASLFGLQVRRLPGGFVLLG